MRNGVSGSRYVPSSVTSKLCLIPRRNGGKVPFFEYQTLSPAQQTSLNKASVHYTSLYMLVCPPNLIFFELTSFQTPRFADNPIWTLTPRTLPDLPFSSNRVKVQVPGVAYPIRRHDAHMISKQSPREQVRCLSEASASTGYLISYGSIFTDTSIHHYSIIPFFHKSPGSNTPYFGRRTKISTPSRRNLSNLPTVLQVNPGSSSRFTKKRHPHKLLISPENQTLPSLLLSSYSRPPPLPDRTIIHTLITYSPSAPSSSLPPSPSPFSPSLSLSLSPLPPPFLPPSLSIHQPARSR